MGTTSQKLQYLTTTKSNIKDVINLTGANILSEDTFRSYAEKLKLGLVGIINNGTSDLYDSFPKTTGEGTEITLNDTYEAPMEIGLNGNTHQDSYTGKNLCSSVELQSAANIRFYIDKKIEKTLTISFTTNESLNNNSLYLSATDTLVTRITADANTKATATFTLSDEQYSAIQSATNPYFLLYKSGANFIAPTDAQIEQGSSATNWEPFVGGSQSPSPDYPQPVKVVTGDNTINIHGKNLAKVSSGNNVILTDTIQAGTYTFSLDFYYSVGYSLKANDGNGETIVSRYPNNSGRDIVTFTINTPMKIFINGYSRATGKTFAESVNNYQLEQGSTVTPYQPYQSKNYEINLKSKNLFDKNTMTMTNTFVNPEIGSSNGFTSIYTPCTPNTTYTISKAQETSRFYVGTTETLPTVGMTATVVSSSATGTTKTFTTGANANYIVAMVRSNNDTLTEEQIVAGIQIEENSTATEYEEFYDYKLCKIEDYKDKIDKSTGKNLWNEDYTNISTGIKYKTLNVGDGTFTMSSTIPQSSGGASLFFLAGNVSSGASASSNGVDITTSRTISSVDGYVTVGYRGGGTFIDPQEYKAQIEQNSQATDYEPYGKVWYIKKNIGKIVLDGSENWSHRAFPDNSYLSIKMTLNVGENGGFCNYFISDNRYDITPEHMTISKQWKELCFAILKSRLATEDEAGFKDWLSTHNPTVYYILKTPTGDKITNNTLISQLEEFEKAKSVDNKTFISQINEQLPFILDVSALSKN